MKVRQGFVSNSSSSSFIIRGVVITEAEALVLVKDGPAITEDYDLRDAMDDKFPFMSAIDAREMRNQFDGDDEEGYIIGKSLGSLDDGSFTEIREFSEDEDAELMATLAELGVVGVLRTYVKMVSNDNY